MKLAEWRKLKKLSRHELAFLSRLHPTTLAYIERGIIRRPKLETVLRVCAALGVPVDEIDEFAPLAEEDWLNFALKFWAKRQQTMEQPKL